MDCDKFAASFGGDVPALRAAFMADSQVRSGVRGLSRSITDQAWRVKPSWYLVATDDRMIPLPAERALAERARSTVTEAAGSHAINASQGCCCGRAHPASPQVAGHAPSAAPLVHTYCLSRSAPPAGRKSRASNAI